MSKISNKITISGHANYADYGQDIVCASVSSIVGTIVNCIMNIDKDSIIYFNKCPWIRELSCWDLIELELCFSNYDFYAPGNYDTIPRDTLSHNIVE